MWRPPEKAVHAMKLSFLGGQLILVDSYNSRMPHYWNSIKRQSSPNELIR
jgi:hypothetical protein